MKRLEIKESITRERETMYIVVLTILISLQLKEPKLWLLIPIGIIAFLIFLLIKRLIDRKPRLVIDEIGIHNKRNKKIYNWKTITDIETNFNSSSSFKLLVRSKNSMDNIDLSNLNISPKEINEAVDFFSGNKISTGKNKFRKEIQRILKNNENLDEIMLLFSKYKKKVLSIGLPIFFGIPALSIYLQIKLDFPYVFAIGYLITGIIMYGFMRKMEMNFKQKIENQNLTEKEYNQVSIKYELKIPENKRKKILKYIFLSILTIAIFVISYIASK